MNNRQTDLEAELASLQPSQLSTEALRGIDQGLRASDRPSWRLYPRLPLIVAALATACFLIGLGSYWSARSDDPRPKIASTSPARQPEPSQTIATLAVYRQAAARGPGALDALLDREAAVSLRTKPENNLLRAGLVPDPDLVN